MKTPHYCQEAGLPWATVDLHCHTTLSDGCKTARELVSAAINKGPVNAGHVELLAVTDHDAVNDEAVALLKKEGIDTCEAAEISACDYEDGRQSFHMTYYARVIGRRTRDVLAGIRGARENKVRKQCALLAQNGFDIDFADMEAEAARRKVATDCLNNKDLAEAVLSRPANVQRARDILAQAVRDGKITPEGAAKFRLEAAYPFHFLDAFLKRDGTLAHIGCAPVPNYEPDVALVGELAREDGALATVAHPNFNWAGKGAAHFLKRLEKFAQLGVRGVELHAQADNAESAGAFGNGTFPENWPNEKTLNWQNAVRVGAERHGLFLTYGSDWHGKDDGKHGDLADLHPSFYEGGRDVTPRCALDLVREFKREFMRKIGVA